MRGRKRILRHKGGGVAQMKAKNKGGRGVKREDMKAENQDKKAL